MKQKHKTILALILGPLIVLGAYAALVSHEAEWLDSYCGMHGDGYGTDTCIKHTESKLER